MRHLKVRRTKSVFATSLSSSVEMLATSPFVLSPFAESFSGRWETVSVGTAAKEGAILSSLEQRGCELCPWQKPDHLARHDGERRSYIVLCAPHDVCSLLCPPRVAKCRWRRAMTGSLSDVPDCLLHTSGRPTRH